MLAVTFLICIYYNMIIAWTIFYTFAGFTSQLPWQYCGNEHNSATCYSKDMAIECNNGSSVVGAYSYYNNTCTRVVDICERFDLGYSPLALDVHNFTMCSNGTDDISLDKVRCVARRQMPQH